MSAWRHYEDGESIRTTKRFAWRPIYTFDDGWIWLESYWLRECRWSRGGRYKYPYRWFGNLKGSLRGTL